MRKQAIYIPLRVGMGTTSVKGYLAMSTKLKSTHPFD